jgi:Trypsin-like peptidase domain/Glutathione S-transferase, N-terminal domain
LQPPFLKLFGCCALDTWDEKTGMAARTELVVGAWFGVTRAEARVNVRADCLNFSVQREKLICWICDTLQVKVTRYSPSVTIGFAIWGVIVRGSGYCTVNAFVPLVTSERKVAAKKHLAENFMSRSNFSQITTTHGSAQGGKIPRNKRANGLSRHELVELSGHIQASRRRHRVADQRSIESTRPKRTGSYPSAASPRSSRSRSPSMTGTVSIRLALAQLNIPYRLVEIDILKGETRTPEFRVKNPNGHVPLLEASPGRLLPEPGAILWYLAGVSPLASPTSRFMATPTSRMNANSTSPGSRHPVLAQAGCRPARPHHDGLAPRHNGHIVALGYPLRGVLGDGLNVTTGTISALSGLGNDSTQLQFTAAIQPGNSGGALVDRTGALVGVVVRELSDIAAIKGGGFVPQGVNFAIRKEIAIAFLEAGNISLEPVEDATYMTVADIARRARKSVAPIVCRN